MAKNNETTTKFKVDISELKQSMQEARRQVALANSEFKAASSGMDNWGKSSDGISAKLKQLNSSLQAQKAVLGEYEKILDEVKREYGENSKEATEYQTRLNSQQAVVNSLERQIREYSDSLETAKKAEQEAEKSGRDAAEVFDELSKSAEKAGDSAEKSGGGFSVLKGALADLVADGIRAAGAALKDLVTDSSEAFAQFSAATGVATEAMGEYEEAIKSVYKNNFGESLEDVAEKMARVKEITGELDAGNLQTMTEKAIMLEDVFGMDMTETLRGVQSLMTHFGMTAEEAFDYLASGAQNGLNYTDELGDNLSEYAGKFAEAGYSAEEYFQLLQNGAQGGAYNLDKVNDAINEVTTRMADGTIGDELGKFSAGTKQLFTDWQNGGATQKQVIESIIADIQNTKGEQDKMNLAALAFGTMAEDGGTKFIQSLSAVGDAYGDVKGKADELAAVKYDTPKSALEGIGRTIKTDLLQPLVQDMMPYLNQAAAWAAEHLPAVTEKIRAVCTALKEWLPVLAAVGAGIATFFVAEKVLAFIAAIKNGTLALKAMAVVEAVLNALNPFTLIAAGIALVVAAFVLLWNKSEAFRNFFINLWKNIKTVCGNAVSAIAGFFTKTLPKAIDKMLSFFKALPGNIWKFLLNAIKKAADFAGQMGTKAKETGAKFISFIITAVKELPGKIWTWFVNTAKKVVEFGSDLKKKGKDAAKHLLNAVVDGIKSLPGRMKDVGTNLVKGLWNGIKNVTSWVIDKVKGFGKSILDGIKSFFGIHSPSRVLRDQVGKNIALGLAEGITKNRKYAVKSAEKMGELILNAAKDTLDRYETYHKMSLQSEVDYWNKIRKSIKKGTKARLDADKEYLAKKKELNTKLKELDRQYKKDCKDIYNQMVSDVEAVSKKYEESVNSRANAITSSLALFKEFSADDAVSKTDLTGNLKSQVMALREWNDVLVQISKRNGVTDGLMEELQNMGVGSLETLKELNSMSDRELKEYIALYNQKNELAKARAVTENEDLKEQSEKEIKNIINDARKSLNKLEMQYIKDIEKTGVKTKKKAKTIGKNTVKGIEEGINAETGSLYKSITKLMNGMLKTAKSALKIHSPSRIMRDIIGKNIALGVADGIGGNTGAVLKSMKELTEGALSAAHAGLDAGGKQPVQGKEPGGKTVTVNNNYNQTINSPKPLSRLEIYRQTRNLLGFSGGV